MLKLWVTCDKCILLFGVHAGVIATIIVIKLSLLGLHFTTNVSTAFKVIFSLTYVKLQISSLLL